MKLARNAHPTCTAALTAVSMITAAHNQCREPQSEWVKDKEMANFCDYFEEAGKVSSEPSKKEEALRKLDDLFKKK